jgi:hypothetical protein
MLFTSVFVAALVLTKPLTRDLYLTYPAVYLLAAGGADHLARSVSLRLTPRGRLATHATRARLHLAALVLLLVPVVLVTNADLWGNYHLPVSWFRTQ